MTPHVLVARLDNAGDVLLAGPAVRAVAAGARHVTMLCSRAGAPAAALLPGVDDVITFDAPWVGFDPPSVDRDAVNGLVDQLAELAVDEACILTSFHQSPLPLALLLRLAGVVRIAAHSVDYPGRLLDVRHAPPEGHEVERALSIVGSLGHALPVGDDGHLAVRRPLPPPPPSLPAGPYVVVHPGASVPARAWPAERAQRLVELLAGEGHAVVVTGGRDERELTARVAGRRAVDLGGAVDLAGLAAVLDGASSLVVGNTGPAHLAAAVGTPVISIFAPVVPSSGWHPWRVPTVVLGDQEIHCAGCRSRTCPVPEQPCLRDVTPERVLQVVRAFDKALVA
ncbi:MAG: glycosyltransferase family 9 protein [Acidimicrobiales bacterium]